MDDVVKGAYCIEIESPYMLPVDKSIHGMIQELRAEELQDKRVTPKLAVGALESIPVSGKEQFGNPSIYEIHDQIRFQNGSESGKGSTSPIPVFWEVKELLKAICIGRSQDSTRRGESLAEVTIEILTDQLKRRVPNQIADRYQDFQLLKESYVQRKLVADIGEELEQRLRIIDWLTSRQPVDVALNTMPLAFPVLDELIIRILQEYNKENADQTGEAEETREQDPAGSLDCVQSYYKRLMEPRPAINPVDSNLFKYRVVFQLNGCQDIAKDLKQCFDHIGKNKKDSEKALQENAENLYGQYLKRKAEELDPESTANVIEFSEKYADLANYIQNTASWEETQRQIEEELYHYIRDLFSDVENRNFVPYDYSFFRENNASTAFIKELCRHVHNRIRAEIHTALRLIQKSAYLAYFYPIAATWNPEIHDAIGALLKPQLQEMMGEMDQEVANLKKKLQDITEDDGQRASAQYEQDIMAKLGVAQTQYEQERDILQRQDSTSILDIQQKTIRLLRTARMVAVSIADQAIEEMRQQFLYLDELFRTYG